MDHRTHRQPEHDPYSRGGEAKGRFSIISSAIWDRRNKLTRSLATARRLACHGEALRAPGKQEHIGRAQRDAAERLREAPVGALAAGELGPEGDWAWGQAPGEQGLVRKRASGPGASVLGPGQVPALERESARELGVPEPGHRRM